jgi:hypothetical protein
MGEVWLTARVRRRDKMDGIAPLPIAPSCLPIRFPRADLRSADAYVPVILTSSRSFLRVPLSIARGAVGRSAVGSGPLVASKWPDAIEARRSPLF